MNLIEKIEIVNYEFEPWKGLPIADDYNGKAVLSYNNEPLFAELVVLRMFQERGYNGVWVDNYRKKFRIELPEKSDGVELPVDIKMKLDALIESNKGISGCWDLLLWKDDEILFIELKRKNKDAIRDSQIKWLENAIANGYPPDSFKIIEWDLIK